MNASARPAIRLHLIALLLALSCGVLVQAPHLFLHRAFVNLDFTVHYNYARETFVAMQAGDFWPHYAFQAQDGLGEPGLLYYAPLYYMLTWALAQATGTVWTAMQGVEVLSAGALGYFSWRLAAGWGDPRRALAAVPLAVLAPMGCLLHLSFNGYPWASALGPLAMLTWATLRPEAQGRVLNLSAILALALTVATHTVTGLMAVILLGALGLAELLRGRLAALRTASLWAPALTGAAGLLLSAAYLLPGYGSQDLIDASVWRQNYTPYNAFSLSTVTAWVFGVRWFAFQWPVSLVAFALAALPLALAWRTLGDPAGRWFRAGVACAVGVILFLATELSYPLWLIDSPLRNIQFPHRLITVLVPLGAALVPIGWERCRVRAPRAVLAAVALASVGLGGLVVAKAAISDGAVIDVAERTFLPYPGLAEYSTRAALDRGNRANAFDFRAECAQAGVTCSEGLRQGRGMVWHLSSPRPARLRLPVYCFPAWSLGVNGAPAAARCDDRLGLVEVAVPAGSAQVALQWQDLPLQRLGKGISAAVALLLVVAALAMRFRDQR